MNNTRKIIEVQTKPYEDNQQSTQKINVINMKDDNDPETTSLSSHDVDVVEEAIVELGSIIDYMDLDIAELQHETEEIKNDNIELNKEIDVLKQTMEKMLTEITSLYHYSYTMIGISVLSLILYICLFLFVR